MGRRGYTNTKVWFVLSLFCACDMASEFLASACPHDCPSTCALEVERLDAHTIGKVRGAVFHDTAVWPRPESEPEPENAGGAAA